jgi:uncharacterized protein (DUF983 family)
MYSKCSECGLSYYPEQGYYLGAMIINYIVTTALILGIFLLSLLFRDFTGLTTNEKLGVWISFAIVLSLALMRHAYSFWLGLDFWVTPRTPDPPMAEGS